MYVCVCIILECCAGIKERQKPELRAGPRPLISLTILTPDGNGRIPFFFFFKQSSLFSLCALTLYPLEGILSQCTCVLNPHIAHFKYPTTLSIIPQ